MFVGRQRELKELEAALSRATAGSGTLYLVSGEPGIGKSRLVAEIADLARERGIKTTWGRCWEAGGAPAYWPWREAFDSASLSFPDPASITAPDPGAARFAFFREVAAVLAGARPLLVILEDVHAADRSSLLLLEGVAAQLRTMHAIVVATYRDLEASLRDDISDSIARLVRAGHVLQLPRLREPDVTALVHDQIEDADDALVATIFEATQGNALFVDEIVRDVRVHGPGSGLPLGVREIIRQRVALLSPDTRGVVEIAAVLGVELRARDLASLAGSVGRVDDAVRAGVLVARGDKLRFSHALYREGIYHDLGRERRCQLHREAAQVLADSGAPAAEIAHHLLEAGPALVSAAIDRSIEAAAVALDTFAFEDAVALLERARAAIPAGSDGMRLRCRVSIARGEAALRSGDATGRATCLEAARIARELGDAELLAAAGLAYGSVFLMGGVDPALVAILEAALAELPSADSPLRARVMARLAAARQPSPQEARQRDIDLAIEAIDMAHRVANRRELLAVLVAACGALYGAASPRVRLPIAREIEALAEELGDVTRLLQARTRMALDYLELGDLVSYAQLATSYEQLASRIGPAAGPWRVPLMRSMCALAVDDFEQSLRWQAEARRIDGDQPRARIAEAFHRICYLRAAERHAELRAALPELRSLWLGMPYGPVLAEPRVAAMLARIGAPEHEIREIVAALSEHAFVEEINSWSLAEAAWALADRSLAERLHPVTSRYAERWTMYWLDVEIVDAPGTRALAFLDAMLGRWDACERNFAAALAAVEALGRHSLAARMRFELGDLFVRLAHDVPRATALIGEARARAASLGLGELVAMIDRRHPPRTAAPIPASAPARFSIAREGEYYAVTGSASTLRFKASRGMQYLATLVERPNVDIHVLELVGSGDADRSDAGALLDATALRDYRARLQALRDAAEDAELVGDADRAARAREEMEDIAAELARGSGKGGRARRADSAVDRARSAVQRRLKDAVDRIEEQDPALGAWLRRSLHTGNHCSYRPIA